MNRDIDLFPSYPVHFLDRVRAGRELRNIISLSLSPSHGSTTRCFVPKVSSYLQATVTSSKYSTQNLVTLK